jgi:hypothetical protein
MNRIVWLLLLLTVLPVSLSARADEKAILAHVEKFRDGSGFFQKEEYRKAALAWSNEAVAMLEQENGKAVTLAAGFASILSSIAYQRAQDALAYAQWGNATQQYLSAGTSWDEQRAMLFDYLTLIKKQLEEAAASDNAGAHMEPGLQFLIALDGLTGISVYERPDNGLRMQENALQPVVTENRSYFARPLSVVQQEEQVQSARESEHIASSLQNLAAEQPVATPPPAANDEVAAGDGSRERPFKIAVNPIASQSNTKSAPAAVERAPRPDPVPAPKPATVATEKPDPVVPPSPPATVESTKPVVTAAKNDNPVSQEPAVKSAPANASPQPKPASVKKEAVPTQTLRDYQLNDQDMQRARRAWSYFERNRHPDSGFVSSVEGSAEVSSWDLAGQLAAVVSAHQVGVIDDDEFSRQARTMLRGLGTLPLYDDQLPNRYYRIDTVQMSPESRGWSAVSTGRLLIWLRILANWYPELRTQVMASISRWQFSRAIANGQLNSATQIDGTSILQQEGRLGFEQYAAAGFKLWGLNVDRALTLRETNAISIYNVELETDKRPSSVLVSDPFVLGAMELSGVHPQFSALGENIFKVQRARWRHQKRLTAKGRDMHQQAGAQVVNHIYHPDQGTAFNCSLPTGSDIACQSISTKIAYGWHALYGDEYSQALLQVIEKGVSSVRGFYAGVFEDLTVNRAMTLDANAMVLESLLLKFRHGEPFLQSDEEDADQLLLFSSGSWD